MSSIWFQSTRPRGARHIAGTRIALLKEVSIHAPTGGATKPITPNHKKLWFQSTRPRGARHRGREVTGYSIQSFNPRAHGGRDKKTERKSRYITVSIHAPTGGATKSSFHQLLFKAFQSTRPRGARPADFRQRARRCSVSIHAPTGGATMLTIVRTHEGAVSIHAPTGGATEAEKTANSKIKVSIHAPTGGATPHQKDQRTGGKFQSTRPRGARPG